MNNNSPLESLAAFAITFISGALSVIVLNSYVDWVKQKERRKSAV